MLDYKVDSVILLKDEKIATILHIFRDYDAIRVEFENGIKGTIRKKDIKEVIA